MPIWPIFYLGLLRLTANLHTKFEVSNVPRSRNIQAVSKIKSRSRDLGYTCCWPNFAFLTVLLVISAGHTNFDVGSVRSSKNIAGVPKFKSRSRNLGHAPLKDPLRHLLSKALKLNSACLEH